MPGKICVIFFGLLLGGLTRKMTSVLLKKAPTSSKFFAIVLFVGSFGSCVCSAQILYDNGPPYHPAPPNFLKGFEMTAAIEADDFTLTRPARITGIVFYDLEGPTGFQNSITWQIYSDASDESPGTVLCGDLVMAVTHDSTGVADINTEYRNTFAIAPIVLPAGSYWLGLHNGPLSTATYLRVYFEKSAAASVRPSQAYDINHTYYDGWGSNSPSYADPNSELAFQLIGVSAAQITALSHNSGFARVTFTTTAGQYYRVEYEDALVGASWNTVPGAGMIAGDGNPVQVQDSTAGSGVPRRLYRVILL